MQPETPQQEAEFTGESVDLTHLPSESFLVGTFENSKDRPMAHEHLDELAELTRSYGGHVVGTLVCSLKKPNARTYLGEGKVEELKAMLQEAKANLVIFDQELTPSQQRNLEAELKVSVADRTELILGVFAKHARTREARLQIELAQIHHHLPRLKRLWTHLSRQRGGGVNQKGEGETQLELDKRILKKRLELLKGAIEEIQKTREVKHLARERSKIPSFAIIGYTNAGKSSLMNTLTDAAVLAEDKLFATLDTTTRKYQLPTGTEVLMIDTVGFIRKLPHLLVAAFGSTLREAIEADILLHLVDASHQEVDQHIEATTAVLKELGALDKERLLVFNKIDQIDPSKITELKVRYPGSCFVSALTREGLEDLFLHMNQMLSAKRQVLWLRIPQERFDVVNYLYQVGKVDKVDYIDNDVIVKVELVESDASRLSSYRTEPLDV